MRVTLGHFLILISGSASNQLLTGGGRHGVRGAVAELPARRRARLADRCAVRRREGGADDAVGRRAGPPGPRLFRAREPGILKSWLAPAYLLWRLHATPNLKFTGSTHNFPVDPAV